MLVCLCFSNGGFEEETQRGTGESQKAEQWGARSTDVTSPPTVSNSKSVCASVVVMDTFAPGRGDTGNVQATQSTIRNVLA